MHPSLVKNVIYPAYRFLRRDNVFPTLREFEKNQWLSRDELKELQWVKLKRLLDYAYKNVPYYTNVFNELGLKPENINDADDFNKIPILTKEEIRNNSNKMITLDESRKGEAGNTGGSTGEPLYFYKDVSSSNYSKANMIRLNKWCGINIGDKEAAFWGTPFDISRSKKISEKIKMSMQNVIFLSTFDMSEKSMLQYAQTLRRFKPKILRGYPSALFAFADFLKKNNIAYVKPKIIILTGEKSFSFQKELIEEVFGNIVYDRYGSNEFPNIAHECADHHGLHLINDMYYIEFLNDNLPARKGEVGEIVITDLHNYYMPFIRYRVGDFGVVSDAQCSCGRVFPLMEKVEGRSFDMIVTPSGKSLGGFFWTYMSRSVPGIKQFQVIQKEKNSVTMKIVPDKDFKMESTKLLEKEIKEKAGQNFVVNFNIVDEIPLTPSGKLRFIVSDISQERLAMKSKIHKATVTEMNAHPFDSITIDEELMEKVNLKEYEKVLVVNNINGSRLETYVMKGKRGSGIISMNGATTHLVDKGHEIIIISFAWTDGDMKPQAVLVDKNNKFVQYLEGGEF
ncbi:MAG: aspartate 1-decarboxylase [Nitrospirae bacterium]|nr:aspartate 1-decarboxylase [Nitrospirota bacterium]